MLSTQVPDSNVLRQFLAGQSGQPLGYPEVGASRGEIPRGYARDARRWIIGQGVEDFEAAVDALRTWKMFPPAWTRVFPNEVPPAEGRNFAVVIRAVGLYWINGARIVYLVDDHGPMRRGGFAYGTLADHAERGEEAFVVEMIPDGSVWYNLSAFSRPRHWLARLGAPFTRRLQRRFAHDSYRALAAAVALKREERKRPAKPPRGAE